MDNFVPGEPRPDPTTDVDVAVIGAGPVGLATALQLGRAGLSVLVLERNPDHSQHPQMIGIHPPTMEAFRRWGIADDVRAVALPRDRSCGVAWMTRMNHLELGHVLFPDDSEPVRQLAAYSPELPCVAAQDLVEHVLAEAASESPLVSIRLSTTVCGLSQDEHAVTLSLAGANEGTVKARYVVAADGPESATRQRLGITDLEAESYGTSVSVYFRADLDAMTAGRSYRLWWTINSAVQGFFSPATDDGRWLFCFAGNPGKPDDFYTPDTCAWYIREGVGVPDLDVEVLAVRRWRNVRAVAERWRDGRVLFAGDAAHRFPLYSGFGMNSGIQDSVNLSWKLAAVVGGYAHAALLDTYESERRATALCQARLFTAGIDPYENMDWIITDPSIYETIEDPAGRSARRAVASAASSLGLSMLRCHQFGQLPSFGNTTEPTCGYSATAGNRLPHFWARDRSGNIRSTTDIAGPAFALAIGPQGGSWRKAAADVSDALGMTINVVRLGDDASADLRVDGKAELETLGVTGTRAALIRPDGRRAPLVAESDTECAPALYHEIAAILFPHPTDRTDSCDHRAAPVSWPRSDREPALVAMPGFRASPAGLPKAQG